MFTCLDDENVGESLNFDPDWTGNINPAGYANPAIWSYYQSAPNLSNLRICYAQEAVRLEGATVSATVSFAQIFNCIRGIVLAASPSGSSFNVTINDTLMAFVPSALIRSTLNNGNAATVSLYHCTVDHSQVLANGASTTPNFQVTFKNSVLANIGALGNASFGSSTYNGFSTCPLFGATASRWSATDQFQVAGGGAYYLKANSVFRGKGTTVGLPATLLPSLKTKSTQPPIAFPRFMEVTGELTLFPQIPRYVSGAPDLGYYYDVLDYTVAAMLVEGGTINVMLGTAVGFRQESAPELWWPYFYTEIGINLLKGSAFTSHGTPVCPNVFSDVQKVQEAAGKPVSSLFSGNQLTAFDPYPDDKALPAFNFRFSNFYSSSEWYLFVSGDPQTWSPAVNMSLRDCNLFGGWFWLGKEGNGVQPQCGLALTNTIFDRVKLNVDPDWVDQGDPTLYVDLAFQAYNNLFLGGRLRLVPITAGNWIFKDNLFDTVVFEQAASAPLDHDFNGYWPQTARFTPNAANDKVLTSAPAYQTSLQGNYYRPTSYYLPTGSGQSGYVLRNAGSRTVAIAGLAQHTTRVDQTKENKDLAVTIGLHYVATTNSTSTQPKDSESPTGDGIPDYVEDANGNGVWDSGTETKIDTAYTATGVHDSVNSIYDDVDLDGDGMVGRIEKALMKNPLSSDNPLTLAKVTTGNEPDIATFEVVVGSSTLTSVGGLNLNVDGVDARLATAVYPLGQNARLAWNTTYNAPGQHFVQAQLAINGALPPGAARVAAGPLTSFYSPNLVQFFLKESLFNDTIAYLDARIPAGTAATYVINLYDPSTTPRTLIDTIINTTPVDLIRESWSVTYAPNHVTKFTGNRVQAEFTVTLTDPTSGGPAGSGTSTKEISRMVNSEIGNNVAVAYMSTSLTPSWDAELGPDGRIWLGMQAIVDTLSMPNMPYNVYESTFNHYFDPTYQNWGYPGYIYTMDKLNNSLIPALQSPNNRQFFCHSHGTPWELYDSWGNVAINCRDMMFNLGNFIEPSAKINVVSNPYRFVFLNGCEATSTRSWANAFGIFNFWDELEGRAVIGPQAFVGYGKKHSGWLIGPWPNGVQDLNLCRKMAEAECLQLDVFYLNWMNGASVYECLKQAETALGPYSFAPFTTDSHLNRYKGVYIIQCADGLRIGFAPGKILNPQTYPVDVWAESPYPGFSPIYVIGHQGLTRSGCKNDHSQDILPDGYGWPDPGR